MASKLKGGRKKKKGKKKEYSRTEWNFIDITSKAAKVARSTLFERGRRKERKKEII